MFVVILPIIQLIAKNWVSRQHTNHDLKPESVIFIVEVFNALYVSNALHNSSSWKTTAAIMTIDFLHFWMSMFDVIEALNEVKILMAKIPRSHPIAQESFVQIAMRILDIEATLKASRTDSTKNASWGLRMEKWVSSSNESKASSSRDASSTATRMIMGSGRKLSSNITRIFPIRFFHRRKWWQPRVRPTFAVEGHKVTRHPREELKLETIFSSKQRALFIRKSARVLFITEYLVLIECARSYFVQHAQQSFYPALADLSHAELLASVKNVLLYSSFEFVSLIMALVVLKRMLQFSTLHQLAFVLETQAAMVQSKLTTLFVYVMQVPLTHLGDSP
ncbi:hypothetical protein F442_21202 [Phytophthora nicotianae P10297]|uniref:Uncharacterized protein n=1 Tax=Phytophthora nicotianae P10297 TaxID=1317064 RepID=W2Y656_PHYNI|nr:hypothetical protein F442_21202 [Phytophthora nicotianae P10297]